MATLKFNSGKLEATAVISTKLEQPSEVIYIGNREVVIAGVKAKKALITKWDIELRRKVTSTVLLSRTYVSHLIYIPKMKSIICLFKDSKIIFILNRDLLVKRIFTCPFVPYTLDFDPIRYLLFVGGDS